MTKNQFKGRSHIREKAYQMIRTNKVIFAGSSEFYEYWDVGPHTVIVDKKTNEPISCTCSDCSVKRIPNDLPPRCSFAEAVKIKKSRGENG